MIISSAREVVQQIFIKTSFELNSNFEQKSFKFDLKVLKLWEFHQYYTTNLNYSFSNISFLILSFLKKLINNAFEYHRENRMSSEFYHTIHIHSDCIEFEQNLWPLLFPLRSKSYSWCMNVRAIMQFLSFWQWSDILAEKWKENARSKMSWNPF